MGKPIVPVVQDPGVRHFLRTLRRALLMVVASIEAVCPEEERERTAA